MASITLCDGDPVVEYLRSTFGANIVRVPRASLRPLTVLAAADGGPARFMGQLRDILEPGTEPTVAAGDVLEEPAPQVLGKRTGSVGLKLGASILGGLLKAFGISADVSGAFDRDSEISFRFHDVRRVYIEPNRLGRLLEHAVIDRANPGTASYLRSQDPTRLLLVDSVLTSPGFTISASRSHGESADIKVPLLQQVVSEASAGVDVKATSSSEVSFEGAERLTFAFTCLSVTLGPDAHIASLDGYNRRTTVQSFAASRAAAAVPLVPTGVLLSDDPALLDIDGEDLP